MIIEMVHGWVAHPDENTSTLYDNPVQGTSTGGFTGPPQLKAVVSLNGLSEIKHYNQKGTFSVFRII